MFVWLRSLFRASSPRRVRRPGPATRLTREPGSAARRPVQPVDLVGLATTYPPELHRPADPAAFGDRCESVARAVRAQREQVNDAKLTAILDEIELRAAVELAKLTT